MPFTTDLVHVRMHFAPNFRSFDCQVDRATALNFLRALTNLVNVRRDGNYRANFDRAKIIALIARWRTSSGRCRQYFLSIVRKMSTSRQVGVDTKRGAGWASCVFRYLIESPQSKKKRILEK